MLRWQHTPLAKNATTFGDLSRFVKTNYSGEALWTIRTLLYWLQSNSEPFYRYKVQTSYKRRLFHEGAENLGLQHYTLEFEQERYYCRSHKKYCSQIRNTVDDRVWDSDHECSDNDIQDDRCDPQLHIHIRRHVFIVAPDIGVNSKEEFELYLKTHGYYERPPFAYLY